MTAEKSSLACLMRIGLVRFPNLNRESPSASSQSLHCKQKSIHHVQPRAAALVTVLSSTVHSRIVNVNTEKRNLDSLRIPWMFLEIELAVVTIVSREFLYGV